VSSHTVPFANAQARHVLAEDVTSREALLEQLRHQAFHDELTGLPNRALAVDRLAMMVGRAARNATKVAVVFCDLDGFKPINDSLGHSVGDELLRQTATRFGETLRASDTLARLGGDEFVALCEVDDEAAAVRVAHRLGASLIQPMALRGHEVRVSASIGIAMTDESSAVPDDLIRNADIAMYRAKNSGRGEVEVFAPAMLGRAVSRLSLEQDLRPAMGRGEFQLYYQPVVGATDGELSGFEALARWNHPERGTIAPGDFIDIAEDTGFIITLGAWAIGEACGQLAEWSERAGRPLTMSVNLSAKQLADPGLVEYVRSTIEVTGIRPEQLLLEVTESVLMSKVESSFATIQGIKNLGVGMTIDDFGTGYSSLSYLAKLTFDSLKLDRSFVADLEGDEKARVVAATVINMAHSLGVPIVGEGVETEKQAEILRELGCDMFQGYHFGRPAGSREAERHVPSDSGLLRLVVG
jgi:diguanylate cyclase (GGDEF)-like protein